MTGIHRTLLAIGLFLCLAIGTFVYFIANWDASKAKPIGAIEGTPPFISPDKPRGLGQRPSPALASRTTA